MRGGAFSGGIYTRRRETMAPAPSGIRSYSIITENLAPRSSFVRAHETEVSGDSREPIFATLIRASPG